MQHARQICTVEDRQHVPDPQNTPVPFDMVIIGVQLKDHAKFGHIPQLFYRIIRQSSLHTSVAEYFIGYFAVCRLGGLQIVGECGGKEKVRYAEVTDLKGHGMRFEMTPGRLEINIKRKGRKKEAASMKRRRRRRKEQDSMLPSSDGGVRAGQQDPSHVKRTP